MDQLKDQKVLAVGTADVGVAREGSRQRRLLKVFLVIALVGGWLWLSVFAGRLWGFPHLTGSERQALPLLGILVLVGAIMVLPLLFAGRSPHIRYRPEAVSYTHLTLPTIYSV